MQRGILKHYAHVLPQIFAERMNWKDGDRERLVAASPGHLTIDVLEGDCRLGEHPFTLQITDELQAWLRRELDKQRDAPTDVRAVLEVEFGMSSLTQWPTLVLNIRSSVSSGDKTFIDRLRDPEQVYVGRSPRRPTLLTRLRTKLGRASR